VANVHPQGDLGLLAVAAKGALADQDSDKQPAVKGTEFGHQRSLAVGPDVVSP
jgi:hypothetical protein